MFFVGKFQIVRTGADMETRKKKKVMNTVMVALVAVIVICGVMAAGYIKGWFGGGGSDAAAEEVSGIVNIERSGVAYTLDDGTKIKSGDLVETKSGSSAVIKAGKNTYAVSEDTQISFSGIDEKKLALELDDGETFIALKNGGEFNSMAAGKCSITTDGAVFSVNVQKGSMGVKVFEGSVTFESGKKTKTAKSGQEISVAGKSINVDKLDVRSLNDFNIAQAKKADGDFDLCFSAGDLDKVVADREKEIKQAEKEQKAHEQEVIAAGGSSSSSSASGSSSSSGSDSSSSDTGRSVKTCTISIKCTTILKNMSDLTKGKEKYVPSNGVILAASTVEFRDGESVFDVLKRACDATGIQLEYAYSPGYGTNYIEGINNLYEFDCGSQSGWIYKVNGWSPNYGASGYKLKGGESIVWEYTCKGLGSDAGGTN